MGRAQRERAIFRIFIYSQTPRRRTSCHYGIILAQYPIFATSGPFYHQFKGGYFPNMHVYACTGGGCGACPCVRFWYPFLLPSLRMTSLRISSPMSGNIKTSTFPSLLRPPSSQKEATSLSPTVADDRSLLLQLIPDLVEAMLVALVDEPGAVGAVGAVNAVLFVLGFYAHISFRSDQFK